MRVPELLLVSALLSGVCWAYEDKSVAQYLEDNTAYSTLVQLLKTAGLFSALQGQGPFTIFAPKNAAFSALDNATLAKLNSSPSELMKALKYHVVPEFVLQPMIQNSVEKVTLEGQSLNLSTSSGFTVNGAANVVSPNDIVVNNGVIQPVDAVILQSVSVTATLNIAQLLIMDDTRFKDLYMSLMIMHLIELLEVPGSQYTLFAPVDSGFQSFDHTQLNYVQANTSYVHKELFKYHIVVGTRFASTLSPGVPVYTLHGQPLNITSTAQGLMVDGAHVIQADIPATNGVIHVIDTVMAPADILRPKT